MCIIKVACQACKGVENLGSDGNGPSICHYPDYVQEVRLQALLQGVLPMTTGSMTSAPVRSWDVVKPLFLEIKKLRRLLTIIFARKPIPDAEFSPQDFHSLRLDFTESN